MAPLTAVLQDEAPGCEESCRGGVSQPSSTQERTRAKAGMWGTRELGSEPLGIAPCRQTAASPEVSGKPAPVPTAAPVRPKVSKPPHRLLVTGQCPLSMLVSYLKVSEKFETLF